VLPRLPRRAVLLSLLLSLFATRGMQNFLAALLHSHNFWSFSSTSENHTRGVRFQKCLRLLSLEIPEPDATGYQNLMRQNSKLTRSDATRSTLRPKCPQSQPKKSKQGSAFVESTEIPVLRELGNN